MDYRFTNIEEVTASAYLVCPGATQEDRLIFRQWVWEGIKQIGPTSHWIKTCELKPKNLSFKKPDDLASTVSIGLYNSADGELKYTYHGQGGRVHIDRFDTHSASTSEEVTGRIDLSEDAYYYHLGSNGSDVAYAKVRYLAMPVDKNKLPLIPEDQVFALTMFCRWMWALRKGDNQSEIELARDTWFREKDRIFGANKMPSVYRATQFAKNRFLSLINSFKEPF